MPGDHGMGREHVSVRYAITTKARCSRISPFKTHYDEYRDGPRCKWEEPSSAGRELSSEPCSALSSWSSSTNCSVKCTSMPAASQLLKADLPHHQSENGQVSQPELSDRRVGQSNVCRPKPFGTVTRPTVRAAMKRGRQGTKGAKSFQ